MQSMTIVGCAAVACNVATVGCSGKQRRQWRRAAAECGSCHLNFQGVRTIGGGGDKHGAETLKMVILPESLCRDINFMSAILGQNTKYVFYHKIIYVFVS